MRRERIQSARRAERERIKAAKRAEAEARQQRVKGLTWQEGGTSRLRVDACARVSGRSGNAIRG